MAQPTVTLSIDAAEWNAFKKLLDQYPGHLATAMRKRMKTAGNIAADRVKNTLRMPPPTGHDAELGSSGYLGREALIAGTSVTVGFSARTAGVAIKVSSANLDDKHKGLLKVYNMKSFRHPVFENGRQAAGRAFSKGSTRKQIQALGQAGNLAQWVQEQGRPYFGSAILSVLPQVQTQIIGAMDDAAHSIGIK